MWCNQWLVFYCWLLINIFIQLCCFLSSFCFIMSVQIWIMLQTLGSLGDLAFIVSTWVEQRQPFAGYFGGIWGFVFPYFVICKCNNNWDKKIIIFHDQIKTPRLSTPGKEIDKFHDLPGTCTNTDKLTSPWTRPKEFTSLYDYHKVCAD